jgi:hypothetical protein
LNIREMLKRWWFWLFKFFGGATPHEMIEAPKLVIPPPLPPPVIEHPKPEPPRVKIEQNPKRRWNARKRERSKFGYSTKTRKGARHR